MRRGKTVTLTPNPALDLWTTTAHVQAGPKLRCSPLRRDPGGGGINVSRVIQRLGGETLALYLAGGHTGAALADALAREGVPAIAARAGGSTRQSFSVRDEMSGAVYRFVLPGDPMSAQEHDALLALVPDAARDAAIVVGSGSLPPDAGSDFWARAARMSREAGALFVLDSADGVAEALKVGVFAYRENTSAIEEVEGRPVSWPGDAAQWARGRIATGAAQMIIITEGARGALLVTADEQIILVPPKVEIQSAVGAGDSFVGALCLALSRGDTPTEAMRLAVATATATLLTPATELCEKPDIERLLPLVREG